KFESSRSTRRRYSATAPYHGLRPSSAPGVGCSPPRPSSPSFRVSLHPSIWTPVHSPARHAGSTWGCGTMRIEEKESMCVWNQAFVRTGKALDIVSPRTLCADRYSGFLLSCRLAGSMAHKTFVVLHCILAFLLLPGCASPPARVLSSMAPSYATLPNGYEPLNPTQLSPIYGAVTAIPGDNLIRYLERKRGHALNLLSLSGGGQNGAFGAGFLVGWRESGRRPQFDVVGGVSAGACL